MHEEHSKPLSIIQRVSTFIMIIWAFTTLYYLMTNFDRFLGCMVMGGVMLVFFLFMAIREEVIKCKTKADWVALFDRTVSSIGRGILYLLLLLALFGAIIHGS